jgi:hypothetical protein
MVMRISPDCFDAAFGVEFPCTGMVWQERTWDGVGAQDRGAEREFSLILTH